MGKCVSKHPSVLTIAISEKDLPSAGQIWSKFAASSEYVALSDEHGNQLCEYYYVSRGSSDAGDKSHQYPHQHRQQVAQHLSQEYRHHRPPEQPQEQPQERQFGEQRRAKKSGQSTAETIKYDDAVAVAIADVEHVVAPAAARLEPPRPPGQPRASDDGGGGGVVLRQAANNATNNRHDDEQHSFAHLRLLSQQQQPQPPCPDQRQHRGRDKMMAQNGAGGAASTDAAADDDAAATTADANNNASGGRDVFGVVVGAGVLPKSGKNKCNQQKSKERTANKVANCDNDDGDDDDGDHDAADDVAKNSDWPHRRRPAAPDANDADDQRLDCQAARAGDTCDFRQLFKGQTESKKAAKKLAASGGGTAAAGVGVETKGTAMSFGFRKKLNTTPKKLKRFIEGDTKHKQKQKQDKCNNIADGRATAAATDTALDGDGKDDNGNADASVALPKVHFEKVGAAAVGAKHHEQQSPAKPSAAAHHGAGGGAEPGGQRPGASNRFGYRGGHIVRPSSTGITPTRYHSDDAHDNYENNNCGGGGATAGNGELGTPAKGLVSNLKRRSKSAHAGRAQTPALGRADSDAGDAVVGAADRPKIAQPKTLTFNLNQNSTIEYQRRQFFQQPTAPSSGRAAPYQQQQHHQPFAVNTGMHTNVIVRPTPVNYSKFTLHTVSLPRPEFAVAISLNATTPTAPGGPALFTAPAPATATISATGARAKHSSGASLGGHMDLKTAKHMANSTRRGFSGSREISADSGIASLDMALDSSTSSGGGGGGGGASGGRTASPKRSRSRPRNLQMVMNGRHKFEVRDLDDPPSSESSSIVEPLALPKLPSESQTMPLPLSGLVRSNTVLSREAFERKNGAAPKTAAAEAEPKPLNASFQRHASEESESLDEEKLYLDRSASEKSSKHQHHFRDINTCSSKTSSPGSSIMLSWCNAGESLAAKDCSSLSISSSEDSNRLQEKQQQQPQLGKQGVPDMPPLELNDDDISLLQSDMQISTISSITETVPEAPREPHPATAATAELSVVVDLPDGGGCRPDRPKSLYNTLNESKFAEMALASSTYLLDDETSPTDSLVSSTESEDAVGCKQKKHRLNEELQEKDIDEISPELELCSPISPGTPTHASHSLSLSECGNLIDDEIADQPALLFNADAPEGADSAGGSHKPDTDTPTLMETASMRSLKSQSKARTALQQAIELSLRTPMALRKAVMERAESLDTLSPCESICSDDLMMDFDMNSSMDSIRSSSIRSRSGSDLNKLDDTELFSELERQGSDVMKELNTILRVHTSRNTEKDSIIAHLPARATRLLNRSRLQQQCPLNNADSDSSKSAHSLRPHRAATRASTSASAAQQQQQKGQSQQQHHATQQQQHKGQKGQQQQQVKQHHSSQHQLQQSQQQQAHHHHVHHHHAHHHQPHYLQRETHSSSDDLMLYDKSFRNAMIQDVLQFKKQLLRLRRILQEDEDILTRTETLNPFENDNGQLFASCGLDSKLLDDIDLASLTSSTTDDPVQELADLRRQVVYLQGQVDDRDRTIRLQKNLIEKLEAEKIAPPSMALARVDGARECINTATQTERTRPLSIGAEGLSRSKPEYTSYTTHFPAICNDSTTIIQHQQQYPGSNLNQQQNATQQTRRHTIISTTFTNYNQQLAALAPRRASIAWEQTTTPVPATYKPVRITLIGEPLKQQQPHPDSAHQSNGTDRLLNGNGHHHHHHHHHHSPHPRLETSNHSGQQRQPQDACASEKLAQLQLESKRNMLNERSAETSNYNGNGSGNGYHEPITSVTSGNGFKYAEQLDLAECLTQQQQHQRQQQHQHQSTSHLQRHLNPTVTIV